MLTDEVSIKLPDLWASETYQVTEPVEVPGGWHAGKGHVCPFPHTLPYAYGLFPFSHPAILNNKQVG